MGEISSKHADFTFITSDNPRFEDKTKIISDIENGMINDNYKIIERNYKSSLYFWYETAILNSNRNY